MKYQARDGWSQRDLLRLVHPRAASAAHDILYRWVARGELPAVLPGDVRLLVGVEQAKRAVSVDEIVSLVREYNLPRECVPTTWLGEARVWEALLERMPMTALIRNLATLTRVGLVKPMSLAARQVVERLRDRKARAEARIHPIAVLAAVKT